MNNYRITFSLLVIILVITNCTYTVSKSKLTYIKFGDEKTVKSNLDLIRHYENRLDIKSEFIELGVIIIEGLNKPDIKEIRFFAAEKGADGFVKEGKNFVLIKVLNKKQKEIINQNPQEIPNQNSRKVTNVYEYKDPF